MRKKNKIIIIAGTRPEVIKLASVYHSLSSYTNFDTKFVLTGQHKEMSTTFVDLFDIVVSKNFYALDNATGLTELTAYLISKLSAYLNEIKPELIIVHGDTLSTFCASLSAFYNKIPVHHVEAGLRTGNKYSPWPEEINRKLVCQIADFHYAPTDRAMKNLLMEGISDSNILKTGNTVIDALIYASEKIKITKEDIFKKYSLSLNKKLILVTTHRRENLGNGIRDICKSLLKISKLENVQVIFPVHLNPKVRKIVFDLLNDKKDIHLCEPLSYLDMVAVMRESDLILTDSGGIQEEAPTFKIPVLVLRDTTERMEAINTGVAYLVGTNVKKIYEKTVEILITKQNESKKFPDTNPFGDGQAGLLIAKYIKSILKVQ